MTIIAKKRSDNGFTFFVFNEGNLTKSRP